ncbi:hypothetical protein VTK73DRAFT_9275 [Phialemonium thermophilum]|uniref:Uncharacterized protein n=1 Tax=Phialemonium thermophilum TaxID=223376 RepID=A0ABR3W3H9_9PEZI
MPGRQAHGRSLLGSASSRTARRSKSKARGKALNAFALAEEQVPERLRGVRTRALEPEPTGHKSKRPRRDEEEDEDGDEDDLDDEEDDLGGSRGPQRKRARNDDDDENGEVEEDSEGHEWHLGVDADDDDSEIDSDDAFGEDDHEAFEGFAFRGSSSKDVKGSDDEASDNDDGASLGSDAIDLAQALDQYESSSDEEEPATAAAASGSEDEEESSEESESEGEEDSDNDEEDPADRDALRALISGFAGGDGGGDDDDDDKAQSASRARPKVGLEDLGLIGVKDPLIKKSLKLMSKEEKAAAKGSSKKLDIPLARPQQDKLARSAAFEKASETLDRWTETVKHNRRAEHLFFPLAQNQHDAGLDNQELLPVTQRSAGTELEQTILTIMEESGLGPSSKPKKDRKAGQGDEAAASSISRAGLKELWNERRRERELHSREQARAKRIKKIKSKAYHRVHRKERLRDEMAAQEALAEAGEVDSDEEREAQERRRAMERMGAKHKESKWARAGAKARRAVWDEEFRAGVTDMARMDAELRRRVEGRTGGGSEDDDDDDDDDDEGSGDSGDDARQRLLKELDLAAAAEDAPQSGLMKMKFMQRGEEALRRANDEMVEQLRRELARENGEDEDDDDDDDGQPDVGRRQYGTAKAAGASSKASSRAAEGRRAKAVSDATNRALVEERLGALSQATPFAAQDSAAGAWSRGVQDRRRDKKASSSSRAVEELDLTNAAVLATTKRAPQKDRRQNGGASAAAHNGRSSGVDVAGGSGGGDDSSSDEDAVHLPLAIRDQEMVKRAFAGEDVVGEFEREKAALAEEEDEKEVDNTLPGWGSWVGEGVSSRERKRHTGRFVTKVEGVKKKDRKDAKLDKVIINEKRIKKNDKFLASQLPHIFETKAQYERSLQFPIGQDWSTKETFQELTKPRVLLKPGVIAPMSKPMV